MRLKIGTKFFISFSVIIIIILLISAVGVTGMMDLRDQYTQIVKVNLPVETLISEARSLSLEQVAANRAYIIYKDDTYPPLLDDLNGQMDNVFTQLESLIQTEESKAYLAQLKEVHADYYAGVLVDVALIQKGDYDGAVEQAVTLRPKVESIKKITADWSEFVVSRDAGIVKTADNDMKSKLQLLNILVILSILGAIICGFVLTRIIATPIKQLTKAAKIVSQGDLSHEIQKPKSKDETYDLSEAFSTMVSNLKGLIANVQTVSTELVISSDNLASSSQEVTKVSEQIAYAVSELAQGASQQAQSSEMGDGKILEIVEGLSKINSDMAFSNSLAEKAINAVRVGETSVNYQETKVNENLETTTEVSTAITDLSHKSNEIGSILEVIHNISDQTNLLALNAAIEAARAGEAGKGFSVVADEIRKLAEQSRLSVQQISVIISEVQNSVKIAVSEMDKSKVVVNEQSLAITDTIQAFNDISGVVTSIVDSILLVSDASNKLSEHAKETSEAISDIASVAEETAASSEELAASAQEQTSTIHQVSQSADSLSLLASELKASIEHFKI